MGSSLVAVTETLDMAPGLGENFLHSQAFIELGITLKCIRDMIRTYSQMHRTDKYLQHTSIIWPILING